jgi:hypothetical protein
MNNVFTFDPKAKEDEQRKASLLEVIEEIKKQIENGEIKELVACSLDESGVAQIHVCALDLPGSVGLFEIGKHLLITSETQFD